MRAPSLGRRARLPTGGGQCVPHAPDLPTMRIIVAIVMYLGFGRLGRVL